ncbi:hypothetical protein C8J56DRAFT_1091893 [Mycena floridula]|nr:hypothetical protein C8J56DRAFT_1091893 [Mycena floridula]
MKILLATFIVQVSVAWAAHFFPRTSQTTAACSVDFQWANNRLGLSPCLVAAHLIGACHSNDWLVPAMTTKGLKYDTPSDACSCSWAAYNTLSACAACQGYPDAIQAWDSIESSPICLTFVANPNTYFPVNTPVEGGITIPLWAAILSHFVQFGSHGSQPSQTTTWYNAIFNITQAQNLAAAGNSDLNPSDSGDTLTQSLSFTTGSNIPTEASQAASPNKESNSSKIAPVVGGSAAGFVILGAILTYILVARWRKQQQTMKIQQDDPISDPMPFTLTSPIEIIRSKPEFPGVIGVPELAPFTLTSPIEHIPSKPNLTRVPSDPFQDPEGTHEAQIEPDTTPQTLIPESQDQPVTTGLISGSGAGRVSHQLRAIVHVTAENERLRAENEWLRYQIHADNALEAPPSYHGNTSISHGDSDTEEDHR